SYSRRRHLRRLSHRRHHRRGGTTTESSIHRAAAVWEMGGGGNDDDDDDDDDNDGRPGPPYEVSTISGLSDYFDDVSGRFRRRECAREIVGRGLVRRPRRMRRRGGRRGGENDDEEIEIDVDPIVDLDGTIDHDSLLSSLSVRGDTRIVRDANGADVVHPVSRLLHDRRRRIEAERRAVGCGGGGGEEAKTATSTSTSTRNVRGVRRTLPVPDDGYRIALAIEGGGMRGCVTAGMVAAIHHLDLSDAFDVVYGSSAGTVIGAYFITRQLPWFGPELYYDSLTTAGDGFINAKRFLRAIGLGLLDPRLAKDVIFRRNHGKPVLDLTYLLNTTMQENKPLDWEAFEEMQEVQPLKVIASGLKSQRAFVMDMERGSFTNIEELACCMRASCLLPGVAGPVMNMIFPRGGGEEKGDDGGRGNERHERRYRMIPMNDFDGGGDDYEPLADALLFEPLPYRSAIAEGATHVVCLRSRPDGVDVTGKTSIFEKLVLRRFFLRKNRLRSAYEYMKRHLHKKVYAEQVIELNDGAKDVDRPYTDLSRPHLLPIAVPPGSAEIPKLETGREAIFDGVRRGFARAYDALVEEPEKRGKGMEIAKLVFPDEILNYDPLVFTSRTESAYEAYLKSKKNFSHRSFILLRPLCEPRCSATGLQYLERAHQILVDRYHPSRIVEFAATPPREEFVPILHDLVSPDQQVQVVLFQECGNNVGPEDEAHPPIVLGPTVHARVWIAPKQVAHESHVGNVARPIEVGDLLQAFHLRTESTMHAKYFLVYYRTHGEAVEDVAEDFPQPNGVPSFALVVETINPIDPRRFVISSEDEEILGIHYLVTYEEAHRLEGLLATVDIITQEKVIALGGEAAVLEEAQQVRELPVHVTAYLERRLELE
ncbi:hypothetical protein ACHAXA_007860, partial [Cyclostephanos tholiformis]